MTDNNTTEFPSNSGESTSITTGTRVYDREKNPSVSLVVVNRPDATCSEWAVPGTGQTVANFNEEYPADADVCMAVFEDDLEDELQDWKTLESAELWNVVDDASLRCYSYPEPRLVTYSAHVPESVDTYYKLICYQYARLIQLAAGVGEYGFLWGKYESLVDGDIEMTSITKENMYQLQEDFGVCTYCGEEAETTYDHIIPVNDGGPSDISNQVPACQSCNSAKNDENVIDWYQKRNEPVPRIVWGKYLKLFKEQLEGEEKLHSELSDDERERWQGIELTRNITRRIRSNSIR